jgi:CheY-like chemotaxis protein
MAVKAHEKGLEIAYRVAPDAPGRVVGDPARLRQIVFNLVGNAIKFTESGEVVLSVDCEKRTDAGVWMHFTVKDTGIGIPLEKQQTIFSPFAQADGSTSRRYGGTGLGLSVSAQLVALMGGRIWVESQPERGSVFHFTVCLDVPEGGEAETVPMDEPVVQGLRVLVVDDNASNRQIVAEMLESWRIFPMTAGDGPTARQLLAKRLEMGIPFDLVLLDHDEGSAQAEGLIEWIDTHTAVRAGVILMTTHLRRHPALDRCHCCVKKAIVKPLRPSDLLATIRSALCIGEHRPDDGPQPARVHAQEGRSRPLNILVAEDLPFNQKFILRLLERWGHRVTLVQNGRQALDACQKNQFDIILMDVQMPQMDGFEAARRIRAMEKEKKGAQVPIVAMTAHAMKGDRERCLEAGMDDYIAKPIVAGKLQTIIRDLCPGQHASDPGDEKPAGKPAPNQPHLDVDALLAAFDNDAALLNEIAAVFLEEAPELLRSMDEAVARADSTQMMHAAHNLKGMLRNFQAESQAQIAFALEQMGQQGSLEGAREKVDRLKSEFEPLRELLMGLKV